MIVDNQKRFSDGALSIGALIAFFVLAGVSIKIATSDSELFPIGKSIAQSDDNLGLTRKLLDELAILPDGRPCVVIALSATCRYCQQSLPFYRELLAAGGTRLRSVALFPRGEQDADAHLTKHSVGVNEVLQINLPSSHITGLPTVILADGQGRIAQTWVGQLPQEQEADTLELVRALLDASTK